MANTPKPCQRCHTQPATSFFGWAADSFVKRLRLPAGISSDDCLLAYHQLCDSCFDAVFHPNQTKSIEEQVKSIEDLRIVMKKWESAERMVDAT